MSTLGDKSPNTTFTRSKCFTLLVGPISSSFGSCDHPTQKEKHLFECLFVVIFITSDQTSFNPLLTTPMIGENRQLVTDEPVEFEK
jgi:hypothetical protein